MSGRLKVILLYRNIHIDCRLPTIKCGTVTLTVIITTNDKLPQTKNPINKSSKFKTETSYILTLKRANSQNKEYMCDFQPSACFLIFYITFH